MQISAGAHWAWMALLFFLLAATSHVIKPAGATRSSAEGAREVQFRSSDGAIVFANYMEAGESADAPIVVLLHQAGSNGRGEYRTIAPELRSLGMNVLVVDLRSGGEKFDFVNRAVQGIEGAEYECCDDYADVEAAFSYLLRQDLKGPVFVLGSSYSAALAVQLSAQYRDRVAGFIALSPASGEPMAGCEPEQFLDQASAGMILRPESEMTYDWIKSQFETFSENGVKGMIVKDGVHGASMLVDERTGHDMSEVRNEIYSFIVDTTVAFNAGKAGDT